MKKLLAVALWMGFSVLACAQNAAIQNFCMTGNVKATTQGMSSSNTLQGSYPQCTVTVYLTGTSTLATIYSNAGGTALANPFTANTNGAWLFYAPLGQGYDVVVSGGTPLAMPAPFTFTDLYAAGTGSGVTQITPGTNITVSPSGGTGNVTINATSTGTVNTGTANQLAYYAANGTAVSGTNALPNGTTATTQTTGDNSTSVATDSFVRNNSTFTSGNGFTVSVGGTTTVPCSPAATIGFSVMNATASLCIDSVTSATPDTVEIGGAVNNTALVVKASSSDTTDPVMSVTNTNGTTGVHFVDVYQNPGGATARVNFQNITQAQINNSNICTNATCGISKYLYLTYVGDSITKGYTLDSFLGARCYYVAAFLGIPCTNLGIVGYTSNQIDTEVATLVNGVGNALIGYQIGANNMTYAINAGEGGDTNQQTDYWWNYNAQAAELAVPSTVWTNATAFTLTGTWVNGNVTGVSKSTTQTGATATFSATGSIIYLVTYLPATANAGTATLTCDGTATGATLHFTPSGGEAIASGQGQTAFTRVSGLANTNHSCVVTVTSSSGTVELVRAVGLSGSAQTAYPTLLADNLIPRNDGTSFTAAWNSGLPSIIATLAGDGLNVYPVDLSSAAGTSTNYNDTVHPAQYLQYIMGTADINEIRLFTGITTPTPIYFGGPLRNLATNGGYGMAINNDNTSNGNAGVQFFFAGQNAGGSCTTCSYDQFIGGGAANHMLTDTGSVFVGINAGASITTSANATVGGYLSASQSPANISTLGYLTTWGSYAGEYSGCGTYIGALAGVTGTAYPNSCITAIGQGAGQIGPVANFNDATAVGTSAVVGVEHTVQLGSFSVTRSNTGPLANDLGVFQTVNTSTGANVAATATGCSLTGLAVGTNAGKFVSGTTGTCTVTITTNFAAANGFACFANDLTTPADTVKQTSASTTTTIVLSGTTVSGDVVNFGCEAY